MIPETKGRSLEEMDIVFGAVSADNRAANIAQHEHGAYIFLPVICHPNPYRRTTDLSNAGVHADVENSIDDNIDKGDLKGGEI